MNTENPSILVLAPDTQAPPPSRFILLARALGAAGFPVTIALSNPESLREEGLAVTTNDPRTLGGLLKRHRVVISNGGAYGVRDMARGTFFQVFDVAEFGFGQLSRMSDEQSARLPLMADAADLLLCASDQQADFWLGAATALGRFAEATEGDLPLRPPGIVLPMGHDGSKPPRATGHLAEAFPELRSRDALMVWHAGYDDFLDPVGTIHAVRHAVGENPAIRLIFLPPLTDSPAEHAHHARALAAARETGLLGEKVFFLSIDKPLTEQERTALLCEVDACLMFTTDAPGTRLWSASPFHEAVHARLPVGCSHGSPVELPVAAHKVGGLARPADRAHMAAQVLELTDPGKRNRMIVNLDRIHPEFALAHLARPLFEHLMNLGDEPARAEKTPQSGLGRAIHRTVEKFFG